METRLDTLLTALVEQNRANVEHAAHLREAGSQLESKTAVQMAAMETQQTVLREDARVAIQGVNGRVEEIKQAWEATDGTWKAKHTELVDQLKEQFSIDQGRIGAAETKQQGLEVELAQLRALIINMPSGGAGNAQGIAGGGKRRFPIMENKCIQGMKMLDNDRSTFREWEEKFVNNLGQAKENGEEVLEWLVKEAERRPRDKEYSEGGNLVQ